MPYMVSVLPSFTQYFQGSLMLPCNQDSIPLYGQIIFCCVAGPHFDSFFFLNLKVVLKSVHHISYI